MPGARGVARSSNPCSGCTVAGSRDLEGLCPVSVDRCHFHTVKKNHPLKQALIGPLVGNLSRDARENGHEIPLKPFVVFSSGQG